jgi:hypothetical protein
LCLSWIGLSLADFVLDLLRFDWLSS